MIVGPLPNEVLIALGFVLLALLVASAAVWFQKPASTTAGPSELTLRVRTWWVIVAVVGAALLAGPAAATALFTLISFAAMREFLSLAPGRESDTFLRLWAYAAIPIQYAWVLSGWYGMFIVFVPVYVYIALPVRAILGGNTRGFVVALATLHWGMMATVFAVSHAPFLMVLQLGDTPRVDPVWPSAESQANPGVGLLLLLLLLTQLNDVAQYVWGKSLGKRKVTPTISPGKTWAGLLGGVATTILLAGCIAPRITFLDLPRSLGAGLIIGLGGFFGDLAVSAVKRDRGVKDSGNLLPGHGGLLDRIDSLTYSAPLFFHYIYYLYG